MTPRIKTAPMMNCSSDSTPNNLYGSIVAANRGERSVDSRMDDVALANYVAGGFPGPVEAGRLDRLCGGLLNVENGTPIWFSGYTFEKLRIRHGDINFQHYRYMPFVLLHGFLARGRSDSLVELWWVDSRKDTGIGFFAALKATRRSEVFVETFHRIDLKEARRLLKKARKSNKIVREQANADALLSGGTDHLTKKNRAA